MSSGFGFFRPECGSETVDFSEGHGGGFVVELPALAQVGFLVEVFGFEKSRGALAGARSQDRSVHQAEASPVEKVSYGFDEFGSDLENGVLFPRTQPEMAVFHQERRAVFLGSDGILFRDLNDLNIFDFELESSGGSLVLFDSSPDYDRGLLGERIEFWKERMVLLSAEDSPLENSCAVPDQKKTGFTA
ncbi:hypothetical protein ES703_69697 [subsurface metagenome]